MTGWRAVRSLGASWRLRVEDRCGLQAALESEGCLLWRVLRVCIATAVGTLRGLHIRTLT